MYGNRETRINFSKLSTVPPNPSNLHPKATHKLQKSRPPGEEFGGADLVVGDRSPKGSESGADLVVRDGSPWESYETFHAEEISRGDWVSVATKKDKLLGVVTVRSLPNISDDDIDKIKRIQQKNFVLVLEIFKYDMSLYIITEYLPLSLDHIVSTPHYPSELELAAIIGQILHGLLYLASEKLEHGSLTCSNILVSSAGNVKIATQERCRPLISQKPQDVRALIGITQNLVQKYTKENGAAGIDRDIFDSHPNTVPFLSKAESASRVEDLVEDPLVKLDWRAETLMGLVSFAQVCAHKNYKYPPDKLPKKSSE